jgi:hypothetical protein
MKLIHPRPTDEVGGACGDLGILLPIPLGTVAVTGMPADGMPMSCGAFRLEIGPLRREYVADPGPGLAYPHDVIHHRARQPQPSRAVHGPEADGRQRPQTIAAIRGTIMLHTWRGCGGEDHQDLERDAGCRGFLSGSDPGITSRQLHGPSFRLDPANMRTEQCQRSHWVLSVDDQLQGAATRCS